MVNKFPIPYLDYRRIKNKLFDMTIGDFPPIPISFRWIKKENILETDEVDLHGIPSPSIPIDWKYF